MALPNRLCLLAAATPLPAPRCGSIGRLCGSPAAPLPLPEQASKELATVKGVGKSSLAKIAEASASRVCVCVWRGGGEARAALCWGAAQRQSQCSAGPPTAPPFLAPPPRLPQFLETGTLAVLSEAGITAGVRPVDKQAEVGLKFV